MKYYVVVLAEMFTEVSNPMTLEWASLATAVSRVKIFNWDFGYRHMEALNVAFEIEKLFKGLRTMGAREFF